MTPTELKAVIERDLKWLEADRLVALPEFAANVRSALAVIEGQASPELVRLMEAAMAWSKLDPTPRDQEHLGLRAMDCLCSAATAYAASLPAPPTE